MKKMSVKNVIVKSVINSLGIALYAFAIVAMVFAIFAAVPYDAVKSENMELNAFLIILLAICNFVGIMVSFFVLKRAFELIVDEYNYCKSMIKKLNTPCGDF